MSTATTLSDAGTRSVDGVTPGLDLRAVAERLWLEVRRAWWVLGLLARDLRRRPVRVVLTWAFLLGAAGFTSLATSPDGQVIGAGAFLAAVVLLGLWRALHVVSFRWVVGRWWQTWWRRRYVYGPSWPVLAFRHGLYVTDHRALTPDSVASRSTVARLRKVRHHYPPRRADDAGRVGGAGADWLLVVLPAGVLPDRVHDAAESLTHAWAAHAVRIHPAGARRVWVEVQHGDALAHPVVLGTVPRLDNPDTLASYLEDGVTVGVHEDGTSWRLRLRGSHVLIAGTTGSGKSSLLWSVLAQLATAVHAGLVRVTWLDPKGGMEATPARPLADVVDRVEAMAEALEDLVVELDQRAALLAGVSRQHVPSVASPHRVVIVDELATLTALADSKTARRVEAALGALLSRGRAVGFTVITTTVDPSKDVVRWRGLHAVRVAFRLDEPIQVDMVLGDGALNRGAACDRIPLSSPGVCFVRHDGYPEPHRVRATYVTDDTIRDLTTRWGTRRPVAAPTADDEDGPSGFVDSTAAAAGGAS